MRNWTSLAFAFLFAAGCGGNSSNAGRTSGGGGNVGNVGTGGNGVVAAPDGGLAISPVVDGGAPADGGNIDGGDAGGPPATYAWTRTQLGAGSPPMQGWADGAGNVWLGSPVVNSGGNDVWTAVLSVPAPPAIAIDAIGGFGRGGEVVLAESNESGSWLVRYNPTTSTWSGINDSFRSGRVTDIYGSGDDLRVTSQAGYLSHSTDHAVTFSIATGTNTTWLFSSVRGYGREVVATGSIPAARPDGGPGAPGDNSAISVLYYSADDGATWNVQPTPQNYYAAAVVHSGVIYLATQAAAAHVLRSTDGGASFHDVTPAGAGITIASHGILAAGPDEVWLADGNGRGLLRSTDGGQTWTDGIGGNDALTSIWVAGSDLYAAGSPESGAAVVYHGRRQ